MHNCKACKARITLGIYCEVCERQVGLLADIDALTADRDELQRRLDAVLAMLRDEITLGISPKSLVLDSPSASRLVSVREIYNKAVAIAEGREG